MAGCLRIEGEPNRVLSVSELTYLIKDSLQASFSGIWVAGEVSNLSQPRSGHIYLTLKDQGAQLRAVIWRSTVAALRFDLQDGLEVLCHGQIDVYPPHGGYQLIVRQIEPRGEARCSWPSANCGPDWQPRACSTLATRSRCPRFRAGSVW